jgi:hypothetical protein
LELDVRFHDETLEEDKGRERSWMFMERLLLCDATVCAMHVNPREEHGVEVDDDCYDSCCSTRVSTLVEDIKSGVIALHGFGVLFCVM